MCGINGASYAHEREIHAMNGSTRHRGPDQSALWIGDGMALGHNRLSIMDLSTYGNQPMISEDKRFVLVYNGELYNFEEIRSQLPPYPYKSTGDTEVILAAYAHWGYDCVKRFNGMFAFAIWDTEAQELFVARDTAGIKPLYYYWNDKKFIFSSEIKGILTHDEVSRDLCLESLTAYLHLLYVPEPYTMFRHVHKLPHGTYGVFRKNTFFITPYTTISSLDVLIVGGDAKEQLYSTIHSAVKRQLVSDRPVGMYLSGGIDSTVVLHHMSSMQSQVNTFSVGFSLDDPSEHEKFNADCYLAKKTSEIYGTTHHEVFLSASDAYGLFESCVWHMDEPISKPTAIAMMYLAQQARQHVTVCLGGDGGDELFGGYERYRLSLWASYYQQYVPSFFRTHLSKVHSSLEQLSTPPGVDRYALFMFQKEHNIKKILSRNFQHTTALYALFRSYYERQSSSLSEEEKMMNIDRHTWLPDDSLVLTDKMTMSSGLEGRVPFLDNDVVRFSESILPSQKVTLFETKVLLKEAYRKHLPKYLFSQPKRGWYAPGAKWLRDPLFFSFAQEVFSSTYASATAPLFHWETLQQLLVDHKHKREYNATLLWAVMTFQVWAKRYRVTLP